MFKKFSCIYSFTANLSFDLLFHSLDTDCCYQILVVVCSDERGGCIALANCTKIAHFKSIPTLDNWIHSKKYIILVVVMYSECNWHLHVSADSFPVCY